MGLLQPIKTKKRRPSTAVTNKRKARSDQEALLLKICICSSLHVAPASTTSPPARPDRGAPGDDYTHNIFWFVAAFCPSVAGGRELTHARGEGQKMVSLAPPRTPEQAHRITRNGQPKDQLLNIPRATREGGARESGPKRRRYVCTIRQAIHKHVHPARPQEQQVRPPLLPKSHCLRLPGTWEDEDDDDDDVDVDDEDGDGDPPEGLNQHEHAPRAVTTAFLRRGSAAASCSEVSSSRNDVAAEEKKSGNTILAVQAAITIPWYRPFHTRSSRRGTCSWLGTLGN